jgi:hypothetical protein
MSALSASIWAPASLRTNRPQPAPAEPAKDITSRKEHQTASGFGDLDANATSNPAAPKLGFVSPLLTNAPEVGDRSSSLPSQFRSSISDYINSANDSQASSPQDEKKKMFKSAVHQIAAAAGNPQTPTPTTTPTVSKKEDELPVELLAATLRSTSLTGNSPKERGSSHLITTTLRQTNGTSAPTPPGPKRDSSLSNIAEVVWEVRGGKVYPKGATTSIPTDPRDLQKECNERLAALQEQLDSNKTNHDQMSKELFECDRQEKTSRQQMMTLDNKIKTTQKEAESVQDQITSLQKQHGKLLEVYEGLVKQLAVANREAAEDKAKLEELKKKVASLNALIARIEQAKRSFEEAQTALIPVIQAVELQDRCVYPSSY